MCEFCELRSVWYHGWYHRLSRARRTSSPAPNEAAKTTGKRVDKLAKRVDNEGSRLSRRRTTGRAKAATGRGKTTTGRGKRR